MRGLATGLVALLVAAWSASVDAAPFGIAAGTKFTDAEISRDLGKFNFVLKGVPTPHPAFESFLAWSPPGVGTCQIKAIGVTRSNDAFGTGVRADFATLKAQLEQVYGAGRVNDFLRPGALWDEPREWVMAIRQNERTLQAVWGSLQDNAPQLKDAVIEIILTISALDSDTAYILLQYRFSNYKACQAADAAAGAGAL